MKTLTSSIEPEDKPQPYLVIPMGYYERNGQWYGPCTTVLVYKKSEMRNG